MLYCGTGQHHVAGNYMQMPGIHPDNPREVSGRNNYEYLQNVCISKTGPDGNLQIQIMTGDMLNEIYFSEKKTDSEMNN